MADGMIKPARHPESILLSGDTIHIPALFLNHNRTGSNIQHDKTRSNFQIQQNCHSQTNVLRWEAGRKEEKKGLYTYENDMKLVPFKTIEVQNNPSSFSFRSSGVAQPAQPELRLTAVGPSTYDSLHRSQATRGSVLTRPTL